MITGSIFAFCAFAAYLYLFAKYAANYDLNLIKNGLDVDHFPAWWFRAGVTVAVIAILVSVFKLTPWSCVPLAIGGGASFSSLFRYIMNGLRRKDARYLSPSSWYDWQYMKYYVPTTSRDLAKTLHRSWYREGSSWASDTHSAGRMAYRAEVSVSFASAVVYAIINIINTTKQ